MGSILVRCQLYLSFLLLFACATTNPEVLPPNSALLAPISRPASAPAVTQASSLTPPSAPARPINNGSCAQIVSVQSAEVFRGTPPKSQHQQDAESAYKGEAYDRDDHFMRYVACEYIASINAKRYSYKYYITDVTLIDQMEPSMCESWREKAEQSIRSATADCSDLKRGEYYGDFFLPLPAVE